MKKLPVIDLFSGAGGMSFGFHANPHFSLIGAVDAELGKPSSKSSSLECNRTYFQNIGIKPIKINLFDTSATDLAKIFSIDNKFDGVLSACPPCTDFTRAKPNNHVLDGTRNMLTSNLSEILMRFIPKYFVYENAREALDGSHRHHLEDVISTLRKLGYSYRAEVIEFSNYGLPQRRERTILIASRDSTVKYFENLWDSYHIESHINTVGHALQRIKTLSDNNGFEIDERFPKLTAPVHKRMQAIPKDGGSWSDIAATHANLLIPSMQRKIVSGNLGSYPDVYGRMKFEKPAPTIKRECGHVGNGRYSHPVEDRLLNITEMSMLQGFPIGYKFTASSLVNCYRQIGDAVPPFISFQIASIINWIESSIRPVPEEYILPFSTCSNESVKFIPSNLIAC